MRMEWLDHRQPIKQWLDGPFSPSAAVSCRARSSKNASVSEPSVAAFEHADLKPYPRRWHRSEATSRLLEGIDQGLGLDPVEALYETDHEGMIAVEPILDTIPDRDPFPNMNDIGRCASRPPRYRYTRRLVPAILSTTRSRAVRTASGGWARDFLTSSAHKWSSPFEMSTCTLASLVNSSCLRSLNQVPYVISRLAR